MAEPIELFKPTPEEKIRLAMAAHIAGGMAANPRVYVSHGWKGDLARDSWEIAGKLLQLARDGGC